MPTDPPCDPATRQAQREAYLAQWEQAMDRIDQTLLTMAVVLSQEEPAP